MKMVETQTLCVFEQNGMKGLVGFFKYYFRVRYESLDSCFLFMVSSDKVVY